MMRRFSVFVAAAALLAVAAPAFAASPMPAASSSAMTMSCPKGSTMVKGYKKADGTMVKAYCRKASSMSSMHGSSMMSPAPKATM